MEDPSWRSWMRRLGGWRDGQDCPEKVRVQGPGLARMRGDQGQDEPPPSSKVFGWKEMYHRVSPLQKTERRRRYLGPNRMVRCCRVAVVESPLSSRRCPVADYPTLLSCISPPARRLGSPSSWVSNV